MDLMGLVWHVVFIIAAIILSSLPLYFAVKPLGGTTTILRSFGVMILFVVLSYVLNLVVPVWIVAVTAVIFIVIIKHAFQMLWFRALLAWLLWMFLTGVFAFVYELIGVTSIVSFSLI